MESCRNPLLTQSILLTHFPCAAALGFGAGHIGLETRFTHAESGQWISCLAVVPLTKNDPQGMGSAITYARWYSLCAMLGIVTEDDDGEVEKIPQIVRNSSNCTGTVLLNLCKFDQICSI